MLIKESPGRKAFNVGNLILLTLLAFIMIIPIINVIAGSLATSAELMKRPLMLFPYEFTLDSYEYIFTSNTIPRALTISVYVTVIGTIINMFMSTLMAYPLAHRTLVGRKWLLNFVLFPMLFGGGMIPNFILIKNLGLMNSLWALMLPGAISSYNLIVIKNFFQQVSPEVEDAARIDGASEPRILFQIVLPLSLPVLATFSLFYAVGHWNSYFSCLMYINTASKWTVQLVLRQLIIVSSGGNVGDASMVGEISGMVIPKEGIKNAAIVLSTLPIVLVYPFLQKYFAKGAMLGSVKG